MTSPLCVAVGLSFWLHGCCGECEGGPVNQVNHTSWVAVVTPTDRPKSVRNCRLIEHFCGVVCVVTLPFWHLCWCRGFCHRNGSDLLLFVFIPSLNFTDYEWLPWSICNGCGKQAGNAYPSGHLVPSPLWDLLVLQLWRPDSSNLPCLYSFFHLEYPLVLSRFCF